MNTFLRPTVFKIVFAFIGLLIVVFGWPMLYTFTSTITENGVYQNNLFMNAVNSAIFIIYYPVYAILNVVDNLPLSIAVNLTFTFLETYLISCIISMFFNKK
ncbi:MAG: hypothetical protein A2908_00160 [Candidatus Staskawiczbacteria bacterium RIFCSPLOWO2_01_FULL_38_12b]|uniref:Uncharacterized protein n=1 Tax=Candidatus Staskawiczbacteria bacterium RIFCSPLOWO2_01_FULL_38_12b TaxID=1802214 RepID=A0A1G2IDJ7_9BACT|nr:MAG: hypothetical protein A2908_00160 [Candidatus Staskawiczbacteria bacterium RIFCSPLOWO2_01_FULL_38_12b]